MTGATRGIRLLDANAPANESIRQATGRSLVDESGPVVHIRHAGAVDGGLLAEIGAETFRDSFGADNSPENMAAYLSEAFAPEKQARELADPAQRFLIAEAGDRAVGYGHLKFGAAPAPVGARRPMEIVRIYARRPWIGRGVGRALMRACLEEARQAGCDRIWLGVWERNPRAIAFYRRWGFEEVGRQVFRLGEEDQSDLLMVRPVDRDSGAG